MGAVRRFFRRLTETDEERLEATVREWAETVPGTIRIADAPSRKPVRLAGVVRRTSFVPGEGHESLEAVLFDGTGNVTAVWPGRRGIKGLTLGTKVVVQGVLVDQPSGRKMVNPAFEFAT